MTNYDQKVKAVNYLVGLNTKKVTDKNFEDASKLTGLTTTVVERAWDVFQQTGGKFVDKRFKRGGVGRVSPRGQCKFKVPTKKRDVALSEAASIILEYMNTDIGAYHLCNKKNITPPQFYSWINELSVKGTLFGKTILNHKKYAKNNVLDIIYYRKRPNTKRKSITSLTDLQRTNYKRVGNVLDFYLKELIPTTGEKTDEN